MADLSTLSKPSFEVTWPWFLSHGTEWRLISGWQIQALWQVEAHRQNLGHTMESDSRTSHTLQFLIPEPHFIIKFFLVLTWSNRILRNETNALLYISGPQSTFWNLMCAILTPNLDILTFISLCLGNWWKGWLMIWHMTVHYETWCASYSIWAVLDIISWLNRSNLLKFESATFHNKRQDPIICVCME